MNPIRVCDVRASALLLFAALCACVPAPLHAQFASLANSGIRYAGNSTGTNIYSGDTGAANTTSLNSPSYAVFDSTGNLFLSDTANNCVRKIDSAGNITTVAGLRVNGAPDTCNAALNSAPTPTQGLLAPTGLAIDSAGTLYISDSGHNCVRTLAPGTVDSYATNALGTAAGTCTATDTASVTPAPNGLAVDSANNLYISIRDSAAAAPVNQVLLHASGAAAGTVCYLAGQPSAAVPNACPGITGTASLSNPAGLALDHANNLFIADTGNNCVRELAGLINLQTAGGQCANDSTSGTGTLTSPYALAVTPANAILITQSGAQSSVLSYSAASTSLTQIAGLPNGTPGAYSTVQEGQSALSTPLSAPSGITTDTNGNIFLSDSGNNLVRKLSTDLSFGSISLGATSPTQTITFQINQASTLTASAGTDYTLTANTCTGAQTPASSGLAPATCQVTVAFSPTRPGARNSPLRLQDSVSGNLVRVPLTGTGVGSLSLFTPGIAGTLASGLRTPIALSVDSAGDTYLLEQGNATNNADILFYPAGGGAPTTVVPQGSGIISPTAMAVDPAGTIFIADASTNNISRFGADGSVNTSYITGLTNVSALAIDTFDNLYVAQAGAAHNVIEMYAAGGSRIIAGAGSTTNADAVPAISAQFIKPSGLALGPNGLSIADASGQLVYTVDNTGTIHIAAGNGTSISTNTTQATGTAMLYPTGLAYDAAGDLYIVDQSASRVYQVSPVQSAGVNISTVFGNGASGYSGDGGVATAASLQAPLTVAVDGSAQLYVIDYGNSALRQVTYATVSNINFGDVVIGGSGTHTQALSNLGNASLAVVTPITTSEPHYTVANTTTCASALAAGGSCTMAYTFTPTGQGTITAQSLINSNSFNSPLTVNLTASGLVPQDLPYSLPPETEVYGQPFTQTVNLNLVYPDLAPTGTMSFNIGSSGGSGGLTTCSTSAPFSTPVLCNAQNSHLHIGTYNVNFAYTPDAGNINYHPANGTTTLTVTKAPLVVTPSNVTKLYGAPITFPSPSASITGVVPGDLITAVDSTTATASTSVGTYQITTTLITGGATSLSDYDITYNVATLTIVNTALNVTVNNATRPYGSANPTFSSVTTGAQNGDTFTITYSTTATTTSPVGTYPITATVTGPSMGNYTLTVVAGTLTVTPIPLTVNVADATRTYGTANPIFSATVAGAINGDTFTQSLTTTAAQFSDVGLYPITDALSGPATSNYTITVNPGHLTITPAPGIVTVTAANATRTYGAPNPAFSSAVVGTINGDTVTVTYTTPATLTSPVGTYSVTPVVSGTKAADYTFTFSNGTLTVTPAPLNVAAASASRFYNAVNPSLTGTTAGLLNGDTISVTYSTTATQTSPVGTYPITPTVTGAALSNYSLATTNGTLTINPAPTTPLTVTVANANRAYGATNPVFTGAVTGLVNGDVVTVIYTSTATATSAPGAYPITATVSGAAAANYTVNIVPGTLGVTQAASNVTLATSASPAFYGSSVTFTATISSGASVGTPTGTVTFLNGSTVLGTATVSANGTATYSTSSLLPGNATITATYSGDTDFTGTTTSITQVVSAGIFSLTATPASQFVRGAGSTVYTVTATSAQGFNGPVTLACAGLPSDATCTFATPILTVAANGSATTTMTVTTTAADARLNAPQLPGHTDLGRFAPVVFAAVFPFELTGLGVLFAGTRRKRRTRSRSPKLRLLLLVLCTASLMGLAGCACFTSVYKNYTVSINGTTTVPGVAAQSTSVILSVGQQ